MLCCTNPGYFPFKLMKKENKKRKEITLTSKKWFSNLECMNFYLKTNLCNELMGIRNVEPQCCILQNPAIFYSNSWKKKKLKERKCTQKLEMVFQHRMHEFLLQIQFMHWTDENYEIRTLMMYFIKPRLFSIQIHEAKRKNGKRNSLTSWKCFSNIEWMNFYFKNNLCHELKGIKKLEPQCCIVQTLAIFHSNSWKKKKLKERKIHWQVGNGFLP